MLITKEDLEQLKIEIKNEFKIQLKKRAIDRIFANNQERVNQYLAQVESELAEEMVSLMPM